MRGLFVADASVGTHFGQAAGLLDKAPLRVEIENSACKSVRCADRALQRDVESYLAREHNLGRVGGVCIGTNVGILSPTGELVADQALPGLHIVFGSAIPEITGASWSTRAQLPDDLRHGRCGSRRRAASSKGEAALHGDLIRGLHWSRERAWRSSDRRLRRHCVLRVGAAAGRAHHSFSRGRRHPRARPARLASPRGTSRTDAGVHADGQLAAFDATLAIPARGWVLALNQHLPDDVCGIRSARSVVAGFNPRFASQGEALHRYRVLLDRVRDPRWTNRAWRIGWPIDLERLDRAARQFEGTHDFAAFRSSHDPRSDTVRTMTRVAVEALPAEPAEDPRVVSIVVEGSAFLYNMVRIMVGTLLDIARAASFRRTRSCARSKEGRAGLPAPRRPRTG